MGPIANTTAILDQRSFTGRVDKSVVTVYPSYMMKAVVKDVKKSFEGYDKVTFMTVSKGDLEIDLLKAGEFSEGDLVNLEYVPFANAWKVTK